ncbi:hypothetical protein IFR05_007243 [Cadophora sp. M221]|nr:hypothetical protein IFR05_007243 [Cadophora sp. M221]
MNTRLIRTILREEWGFKGTVMSDWGETNSTVESVLVGCDLEMPGLPEKRGKVLLDHLAENTSLELRSAIDTSCLRILSLFQQLNLLGLSLEEASQTRHQLETSSSSLEDRELLRAVVADGLALIKKNSGILPLLSSTLQGKRIALIGPNAKQGTPGGGGSATMSPQYQTQPLEALQTMLADQGIEAEVTYHPGVLTHKWLPLVISDRWSSPDTTDRTLKVEFFSTPDFTGPVLETQYRNSSHLDLFDSAPQFFYSNAGSSHSLLMRTILTPLTTGFHSFEISSVGNVRLLQMGSFGSVAKRVSVPLIAGEKYEVRVEACTKVPDPSQTLGEDDPVHVFGVQPSVRLGFMGEVKGEQELIADAVGVVREADLVICVLGLNDEWESEGHNRASMYLPGAQDKLVWNFLGVEGVREKLAVVNQSGCPVVMPWADEVSVCCVGVVWGQGSWVCALGCVDWEGEAEWKVVG